MSYEKFVMDLDRCGMLHRVLGGLTIDDNALAADAYRATRPGQNFFRTAHTLANVETANYISPLADTSSYEQWQESGRQTIERRAHQRWQEMLAEYEAPPMDPAIDEALLDFIARKKSAVADQWY